MKSSLKQIAPYICMSFLCAATLLYSSSARADLRLDAQTALSNLHRNAAAERFPDDVKSLERTYEIALRYFMVGEQEKADKFYLLTLQKIRVVEERIKTPKKVPLPEAADVPPPPDESPSIDSPEEEMLPETDSSGIVGSRGVYTVERGDTIRLVAAKLGVTRQHLRAMNRLDAKAYLLIGQKLAYNNRKIIPRQIRDGIIINIPDRTLYYFQQGTLVTSLPVAVGSATNNEKYVWQTPVGKFKIIAKMKDPTWMVPPSIQTEMEEQGKEVIASIPPGPENPLGKYAMKTSIPGILIHSTTKPSSIYSFSSHGCIRVSPNRMEEFFPQIKVNTRGEIIYKPIKLAVTGNGRVYLEVHQDIYGKSGDLVAEARQLVEKRNLSEQVDWEKFKSVVKRKNGVAEDISL